MCRSLNILKFYECTLVSLITSIVCDLPTGSLVDQLQFDLKDKDMVHTA